MEGIVRCARSSSRWEIQVFGPIYRPTQYRVIKTLKNGGKTGEVEDVHCPIPQDAEREGREGEKGWGHGMFWEADEVARCLRDGKAQSDTMPWSESLLIMETMDEVRRQGDLTYPDLIESTSYDAQSPLNGKSH